MTQREISDITWMAEVSSKQRHWILNFKHSKTRLTNPQPSVKKTQRSINIQRQNQATFYCSIAARVLVETQLSKQDFFFFAASFICFAFEDPQRQLFVEEFLHLSIDNFHSKQQVFFDRMKWIEEENNIERRKHFWCLAASVAFTSALKMTQQARALLKPFFSVSDLSYLLIWSGKDWTLFSHTTSNSTCLQACLIMVNRQSLPVFLYSLSGQTNLPVIPFNCLIL